MTTTISPNREKKNAKKAAALAEAEQDRLLKRIRNLFELETSGQQSELRTQSS